MTKTSKPKVIGESVSVGVEVNADKKHRVGKRSINFHTGARQVTANERSQPTEQQQKQWPIVVLILVLLVFGMILYHVNYVGNLELFWKILTTAIHG